MNILHWGYESVGGWCGQQTFSKRRTNRTKWWVPTFAVICDHFHKLFNSVKDKGRPFKNTEWQRHRRSARDTNLRIVLQSLNWYPRLSKRRRRRSFHNQITFDCQLEQWPSLYDASASCRPQSLEVLPNATKIALPMEVSLLMWTERRCLNSSYRRLCDWALSGEH